MICFLLAVVCLAEFGPAGAENRGQRAAEPYDTYRSFASNAEGRYFTMTSEGTAVLELIPAFGRLFASVGYYMGETSLYSYYAAELIPACEMETGTCSGSASDTSFDVTVHSFSNMSMAGNYWPGETRQRLTLIPGGLLLSNYSGTGDALISKESILLNWSGEVPGMFPYGPEQAESMAGSDGNAGIPDTMTGTLSASWQDGAEQHTVKISLDPDGTILVLKEHDNGLPPLLMKGGFAVSEEDEGSHRLCYLMSSPSSGLMPYMGCVQVRIMDEAMIFSDPQQSGDDLLLPMSAEEIVYYRNP